MENSSINNVAVLELSSTSAKYAVGFFLRDDPVLLYCRSVDISPFMEAGEIRDSASLSQKISELVKTDDEELSLKIDPGEVMLVLPPLGFEAYVNNKTTNVVGADGTIAKIDIQNVISLIKKEHIPSGNEIVDIVPDSFTTEEGVSYENPPLGEISNSLRMDAKIHTLPPQIHHAYKKAVEDSGVRLSRACVSVYCAASLIALDKEMPSNYFLIDCGASLTTVTLIGKGSPYSSFTIKKGGNDLTKAIAERFSIGFEEAEEAKVRFGYSERETKFDKPLMGNKVRQKELNEVISEFYKGFLPLLDNAIKTIIQRQKDASKQFDSLPLVLSGGGSSLHGLTAVFKPYFPERGLHIYKPKAFGARDPVYTNLLGLIVAQGQYRGTLEENYKGVSALSRES